MRNNEREYWKDQWKKVEKTLGTEDIFSLLDEIKLEHLLTLLPKTGKTLEVGAGSGRLSCLLALRGYETVCLDYIPEALQVARKNYEAAGVKGVFVLGDGRDLPFEEESFDVVMSTGLLEHFKNPQIIVSEMTRVLKKGGLFYSDIVPKKFSLLRSLDFLLPFFHREHKIYEGKYNKEEIASWLRNSGLQNVHVFPAGVFPPRAFVWSFTAQMVYKLKKRWKRLDGAKIAERIGFYYFAYGYKRGSKNTIKSQAADFYDKRWKGKTFIERSRDVHSRVFEAERIWTILKLMGSNHGKKILEVGCGVGGIVSKLNPAENELVGVDISSFALNVARKKYPQITFVRGNAEQLPFEKESFDIVLFPNVIEHLLLPQEALKEIYRILKKGGVFVISTPNRLQLGNRIRIMMRRQLTKRDEIEHIREFSLRELAVLLNKAGFDIKARKGVSSPFSLIRNSKILCKIFRKMGNLFPFLSELLIVKAQKRNRFTRP